MLYNLMKACLNEKDKANFQALIDKEKSKAPPPDTPKKKSKRSQGCANSRRCKAEK
jgi:23S rRNA pseudoU1915 N3-methylase RlmH